MPDRRALLVSPEAPWPPYGGGPLRTLSILEYLRPRYTLDFITFHDPDLPDPRLAIPAGALGDVLVVPLPRHSREALPRAVRNLRRLARGVVPLTDRFAGSAPQVAAWLSGRRYDVAVVEHAWCAPYADLLRPAAARLVLDLHNLESLLLESLAAAATGLRAAALHRFARLASAEERLWFPRFDLLLTASDADARRLPPGLCIRTLPNTIPDVVMPAAAPDGTIVFSGNMAYEPNRDAVAWFARQVWPHVRRRCPDLRWRLLGRGLEAVASLVASDPSIECTGPVDDAIGWLARSSVAIAPLRAGSGTRVKILEAWAAGVPVVSTSLGCEGLLASNEIHLLVADDPLLFADSIVRIQGSPGLAAQLRSSARALFESQYRWSKAWRVLEAAGL